MNAIEQELFLQVLDKLLLDYPNPHNKIVEKESVRCYEVNSADLARLFDPTNGLPVQHGRKSAPTQVWCVPKGTTVNPAHGENVQPYITQEEGEVVFSNGQGDDYVPLDPSTGLSNGLKQLLEEHELADGSTEGMAADVRKRIIENQVKNATPDNPAWFTRRSPPSQLLVRIPVAILVRDCWGQGKDAYFPVFLKAPP